MSERGDVGSGRITRADNERVLPPVLRPGDAQNLWQAIFDQRLRVNFSESRNPAVPQPIGLAEDARAIEEKWGSTLKGLPARG